MGSLDNFEKYNRCEPHIRFEPSSCIYVSPELQRALDTDRVDLFYNKEENKMAIAPGSEMKVSHTGKSFRISGIGFIARYDLDPPSEKLIPEVKDGIYIFDLSKPAQ